MNGSIADVHQRALSATGKIVAGVGSDEWDYPTPCSDWNVRDLVNHIVAGNLWAGELAAGKSIEDVGDRLDGDVLGDDPVGAYERSAKVAGEVFQAPGALEAPCAVSYGPVPGEVYAGHRFVDVLIHGWDLAKATSQDATLDPELVEAAIEVVEPQLELLQASGAFATGVEVPSDASTQQRLLAWVGRTP